MCKRPRVSLSLIVAQTVRSGQERRSDPPALHLVSPTGGTLDGSAQTCSGEAPTDFIWGRISHGLDTFQQFARCRDWADVFDVQQSWAERMQADYASACARLTGAAIRMVTGATTYPEPPPPAA